MTPHPLKLAGPQVVLFLLIRKNEKEKIKVNLIQNSIFKFLFKVLFIKLDFRNGEGRSLKLISATLSAKLSNKIKLLMKQNTYIAS